MFLAWGGLVPIAEGRPKTKTETQIAGGWRRERSESKRRDRLGVVGLVGCGPGATFAVERPEPTGGGLSARGRQREFSAEREFVPSVGAIAEVGWEIPAKRDFCGGSNLRLTKSHTGRRVLRRPRETR